MGKENPDAEVPPPHAAVVLLHRPAAKILAKGETPIKIDGKVYVLVPLVLPAAPSLPADVPRPAVADVPDQGAMLRATSRHLRADITFDDGDGLNLDFASPDPT